MFYFSFSYAGAYITRVAPISVDIPHKNVTYIKKVIIYDESEGPVRTWMSVWQSFLLSWKYAYTFTYGVSFHHVKTGVHTKY